MFEGFGEASAGSSAAECALAEPKTDFDSTYGVESPNRRHGWRRGGARCAGDCSEPLSRASGRARPGHRRPNVHGCRPISRSTPPMEAKAEIVAMGGDGAPRGAPVIALSHVRRLRGGLGRVTGGRMCTDGAENRF